jgi:hypothetical protein
MSDVNRYVIIRILLHSISHYCHVSGRSAEKILSPTFEPDVSYAVRVVTHESKRSVLPKISCNIILSSTSRSPTWPLPPPGRFLVLISVGAWVDARAIVRLEGLGQLKKCISSGLEPATFWKCNRNRSFAAGPLTHYTPVTQLTANRP